MYFHKLTRLIQLHFRMRDSSYLRWSCLCTLHSFPPRSFPTTPPNRNIMAQSYSMEFHRHAQNLHNCSICNLLLFCIILIVNMHFQSLFHASIGNSIQQPMQSTTTYLFSLSFPSSRILRWTSLASMSKRHTPPNPPRQRMKWSQTAKNIKAIELGMRLEKLFSFLRFLFGTSLKLLPGRFRPSLFTQMHGNPSEKLFCSVSIKDLYTDFLAGWRQPAVCRKLVGVVLVWRFFCRWSINVSHKEMSLAQSLVLQ